MKRLYLIGLIMIILAANIPEVSTLLQSKMIAVKPYVYTAWDGIQQQAALALIGTTTVTSIDNTEDFNLIHGPSISAEQADTILKEIQSPAVGSGKHLYNESLRTKIDLAYVIAMCIQESGCGTNPNWVGHKGAGQTTHNSGNIICVSSAYACYGRFQDFPTWNAGFTAHFNLLADYSTDGIKTIDAAIQRWAPDSDGNNSSLYASDVKQLVTAWRGLNSVSSFRADNNTHPLAKNMHVTAKFSDINCAYWYGQPNCQHLGVDYALEHNEPVYAPFDGVFVMRGNYDDPQRIGDYIIYISNDYELYFGHLKDIPAFDTGEIIRAGDIIGYGQFPMLHTHVQVRNKQNELEDFEQLYNERIKHNE